MRRSRMRFKPSNSNIGDLDPSAKSWSQGHETELRQVSREEERNMGGNGRER